MPSPSLLTSVPKHISPEEHTVLVASTPASFSDIPPVIRYKQENVSATFDPSLEGFTPEDAVSGTLYILESVLVFMSATGRGFQVEYPSITLHAISRAEFGPSIYCQLDEGVASQEDAQENEEEDSPMRELILIPKDYTSLEPIFEALSQCASLHPDPVGADDMDDDDDAFIDSNETLETFDGDERQELSEVGRAALAHMESIIYNPFEKTTSQEEGGNEEEPSGTGDHEQHKEEESSSKQTQKEI